MAAPPSAGVAVSEQERLVALILVLTRDPFLSNPRRSLAGRDSLGLSLEGCEPIGPLASKLCTITPGCRLLLPPPPHSGGRSEYKEPMPQQSAGPAPPDSGAAASVRIGLAARRTTSCLRPDGAFVPIRPGSAGRLTAAVCLA